MLAIKRTIFKIFCQRVIEKVHEIEKDESDEPSDQSSFEYFIETINNQNSAHINQNKNGIPVSYKNDIGGQYTIIPLTIIKEFDSERDLCPLNIK